MSTNRNFPTQPPKKPSGHGTGGKPPVTVLDDDIIEITDSDDDVVPTKTAPRPSVGSTNLPSGSQLRPSKSAGNIRDNRNLNSLAGPSRPNKVSSASIRDSSSELDFNPLDISTSFVKTPIPKPRSSLATNKIPLSQTKKDPPSSIKLSANSAASKPPSKKLKPPSSIKLSNPRKTTGPSQRVGSDKTVQQSRSSQPKGGASIPKDDDIIFLSSDDDDEISMFPKSQKPSGMKLKPVKAKKTRVPDLIDLTMSDDDRQHPLNASPPQTTQSVPPPRRAPPVPSTSRIDTNLPQRISSEVETPESRGEPPSPSPSPSPQAMELDEAVSLPAASKSSTLRDAPPITKRATIANVNVARQPQSQNMAAGPSMPRNYSAPVIDTSIDAPAVTRSPSENHISEQLIKDDSSVEVSDPETRQSSQTEGDIEMTQDELVEGLTETAIQFVKEMDRPDFRQAWKARYIRLSKLYPGEQVDDEFAEIMKARSDEEGGVSGNPEAFEAWMACRSYNTKCPSIACVNPVDDDPCPPWEFSYTERMIYGDGVRKPYTRTNANRTEKTRSKPSGCGCYPICSPTNRNCKCLRKQEYYMEGYDSTGFMYDENGCLRIFNNFPVVECGDGCECSDECMNRVAQFGRQYKLSIAKTKECGWGIFALQDIPRGSFVGPYAGELILHEESIIRGKFYDSFNRNYLFDLDFHYLKEKRKEKGFKNFGKYTIDAMHAGCFTRFLNHSCEPNCSILPCIYGEADEETPYLAFFTTRDLKMHDQLTFNYRGDGGDDDDDPEEQEENRALATKVRQLKKKMQDEAARGYSKDQNTIRFCYCGARECKGYIWKSDVQHLLDRQDDGQESEDDELEEDELDDDDHSEHRVFLAEPI